MRKIENILSETWLYIFKHLTEGQEDSEYVEKIGFSYSIDPMNDFIMSPDSKVLDAVKLNKMHEWYKSGDRTDTSICDYFEEYKHCIDDTHKEFNSNYGYYAYKLGLLDMCVDRLREDENTRQACFCINNNDAMSDESIDKLCTNSIMFFIRNSALHMVVQMRSSNFFSLLPYDIVMFSMFYHYVLDMLNSKRTELALKPGYMTVNVGSIHYYKSQLNKILEQ